MILVILVLPESYRFLIVKGKNPEKVRKILNHIAPAQIQNATAFHVPEEKTEVVQRKMSLELCFLSHMPKVRFCFG